MNPILNIKRALEQRLVTNFPTIPIAFEGVSFNPPDDKLYIRTQFIIRAPDDPTIGSKYYRERISFQVFVVDIANKGTGNALDKACQIRDVFDKGTFIDANGTRIHTFTTPQVSSAIIVENRIVVPVLIDIVGEVYRPELVFNP